MNRKWPNQNRRRRYLLILSIIIRKWIIDKMAGGSELSLVRSTRKMRTIQSASLSTLSPLPARLSRRRCRSTRHTLSNQSLLSRKHLTDWKLTKTNDSKSFRRREWKTVLRSSREQSRTLKTIDCSQWNSICLLGRNGMMIVRRLRMRSYLLQSLHQPHPLKRQS